MREVKIMVQASLKLKQNSVVLISKTKFLKRFFLSKGAMKEIVFKIGKKRVCECCKVHENEFLFVCFSFSS